MTYTAPGPVTNLTAQWHQTASSTSLQPGVQLSWTAPVLADKNTSIGGYYVYILLKNVSTGSVDPVLFTSVRKRAVKDPTQINSYSVGEPPTTVFFPFSWSAPSAYTDPINPLSSRDSYSFHVVAFLAQSNDAQSDSTGVTIYRPNQQMFNLPSHFNPRFTLASSGQVVTMEQDSYQDVANCVEMVLNTPKNLRSALPEFGIDDPTFTQVDPNALRADLQDWEPRAVIDISIFNDDSGLTGDSVGAVNANVQILITDINYTA